jgi:hypothetical protein
MGMVQFRAPALPLPSETYSQRYTDELLRALRIYFNQLDSLTPNQAQSYAADAFFGGEFSGSRFDGGTLSGFGPGLKCPMPCLCQMRTKTRWDYVRKHCYAQSNYF